MINDFLTKGFIILNDEEPFKFIDINDIGWTEAGHVGLQVVIKEDKIQNELIKVQKYLGEKYVKQIDPNYRLADKIDLVNGMDQATLVWHNDLVEGPNLCILAYFDSMDEDVGGAICFRISETKEDLIKYHPIQNDVLIMNQSLKYEHIVTPLKLKLPRRVASFNYFVNEGLTR
tara:strand:- start:319 stop:840 length:522 start_codon:yes stop_codon:yes gene_type:complete